jgi:hypothetical protein
MGTNNRQRRAAKARRRAKERIRRPPSGGSHGPGCRSHERADEPPRFTPAERVRAFVELSARASREGHDDDVATFNAELVKADARLVDRESEAILLRRIGLLWDNGWQPAELLHHVGRLDAKAGRLVAVAVAADHVRRDPSTLHPRWAAQVDGLGLPAVAGPAGWLGDFATSERLDRWATVGTVVIAVGALGSVGPLPVLIPPPGPGAMSKHSEAAADVDDPVLVKVRALLAQAESTTFEAEAAAFTAKAQELMARHAIDAAVLWASSERDERPVTIRLAVADPYADVKALLLHHAAEHSRCRAVRHREYGLVSVTGFASDVAAAETLFTSLLVQSQTALRAEGAKAGPGSRTRSRAFRSSFLMSFTVRIDQRLAEINAAVQRGAEAAHNGSLLPVLAARDSAIDDAVREMFGELATDVVRGGSDPAGWVRGKLAADLAHLNVADLAAASDADTDGARQPALAIEM